jgi:hypothetical protein
MVAHRIVGRDSELVSIDDFIEPGSDRALVLRGKPGIDKTTLWKARVARAATRGIRSEPPDRRSPKPSSRMSASQTSWGASPRSNRRPPGPQRLALDVALLRAEPPEGGLDHRTVTERSRELAEQRPRNEAGAIASASDPSLGSQRGYSLLHYAVNLAAPLPATGAPPRP